jgi:hypothetical protein
MIKTNLISLTIFLLFFPFAASAQEEEEKTPVKLVLTGAYGMAGASLQDDILFTRSMVDKLGYSAFVDGLQASPHNYSHNLNDFAPGMPYNREATHVNLGIELSPSGKSPNKFNASLRLGFQYTANNMMLSTNYSKTDLLARLVRDTLVYLGTKDTVVLYKDSTRTNNRNIRYTNDLIAFDVSYIFRSNPSRSISFLGGIGFAPGLIINSNSVLTGQDIESSTPLISSVQVSHTVKNKMGFSFNFYVPIGVSVRVSKKHDFWKNIYLSAELRPSMSIQYVSELGTNTRVNTQNMAGIRAVFN